jgi:chain length determinant protein EpsF
MNMNLRQALLVLRLRWWVVLIVFSIVMGLTYVVTRILPKQYTADTVLLLDVRSDPLLATLVPNLSTQAFMATQAEIMRSERVASKVVERLGLAKDVSAMEQWREATQGRISFESYYGRILERGLVVEPGNTGAVMNVSFTGRDPKFATLAVNTFARAYIDLTVELRAAPARENAGFFDERLKSLRDELDAAQGRLSAFQQRRGIVVSTERVDQETARLNALESALAAAIAESADTTSRQRNTGTETSVDVSQSAAVQSLRAELARAETRLVEVSATYGSNHPVRIELETRIAEFKQQIAAEMRRVSGTTATISRISSQKITELRNLVEAQKRTVLNLRAQRDEAGVLLREVDTAQRAFDAVAQRRTQLANESQAEQAAARILSPATEPLTFSKPNLAKNMVAALIVGLMLGVAMAFLLEAVDRRVRSADDLVNAEGIPVLGVMSSRSGKAAFTPRLAFGRRGPPPMSPQLTLDRGPQ